MCLKEPNDNERASTSGPRQEVGFDFRVEEIMEVNWGFDDWNLPGILSDYFTDGGGGK